MSSMLEENSWMVRKDNKATGRGGRLQKRLETEFWRLKATSENIGYMRFEAASVSEGYQ